MNKIVNDLALDAGFSKRSDDSDDLIYSPYKEEYDITEELNDFAKLIVLECAKVITNGGYWSGGFTGPKRQATPPEIAEMIKNHFNLNVNNDET